MAEGALSAYDAWALASAASSAAACYNPPSSMQGIPCIDQAQHCASVISGLRRHVIIQAAAASPCSPRCRRAGTVTRRLVRGPSYLLLQVLGLVLIYASPGPEVAHACCRAARPDMGARRFKTVGAHRYRLPPPSAYVPISPPEASRPAAGWPPRWPSCTLPAPPPAPAPSAPAAAPRAAPARVRVAGTDVGPSAPPSVPPAVPLPLSRRQPTHTFLHPTHPPARPPTHLQALLRHALQAA